MFYIILYFITIFSCYSWLVLLQLTVAIPIQFFYKQRHNHWSFIYFRRLKEIWSKPTKSKFRWTTTIWSLLCTRSTSKSNQKIFPSFTFGTETKTIRWLRSGWKRLENLGWKILLPSMPAICRRCIKVYSLYPNRYYCISSIV